MDMSKSRGAGSRLWREKAILLFIFLFLLLFSLKAQADIGDLVISEIMYDASGSDSGREWIEIYNSGTESLSASSTWRFFDSSNHKINFYQGTTTLASNDFFILADDGEQFLLDYPNFNGNLYDTVMSLPNSSSSVALSFDSGDTYPLQVEYDFVYGASGNGYSLEKIDLFSSSTDDWQESSILGGTPGEINSEKIEEEIVMEEDKEQEEVQDWSGLIINELMPNPAGSDSNEWIELYNNSSELLNLEGLKIKDTSARVFILDVDSDLDLNLSANSYLLIPKSVSGISLNNSNGDGIFIMDINDNIIDSTSYNDTALEGRSYARDNDAFVWTKTATPGTGNKIYINKAPVAQISVDDSDFNMGKKIGFSASNSYDPDGEDLDYYWEFGDDKTSTRENIKHSFDTLGTYTVFLTVSDLEGADDRTEFAVNIYQPEDNQEVDQEHVATKVVENIIIDLAEDDLIISEFIPNPEGSDDNEWIELYNASDKDIDLYAWRLDDIEGGSKPWSFASSTTILAKSYLVLDRQDTKITLNNNSDSVRLISPADEIWQEVSYEKIPEGKTYAWDNINNEWNINEASKGRENIFQSDQEAWDLYSVFEISDLEKGEDILLQGVAINRTDKDTRSLYLADYNFADVNFEELVEVYSYHKYFPDIKNGQLLTVQGEISKTGDLPRVKIKTTEDIIQNDLRLGLESPEILEVVDIDEDLLGTFVRIRGLVVKKSGKNIYMASEIDEDYLLRVYTRFSTKDLEIKKGDEIIVSGLFSETESGFKIAPFDIGDIAVSKQVLGEKIEAQNYEEISISTSTSQVIVEDEKNNVKNVLIFILIFLFIISIVYYIKNKK